MNAETDSTSAETDNTNIDDPDSQVPAPTPQYQIPANQLVANECSDGVISLRPVSAITVESNEINNTGDLLLSDSGRSTILQFDLSSVPATVTSAVLSLSLIHI